MERTLLNNEKEYKNLLAVAKMLEAVSVNGLTFEVKDCYFDYGQDWMWTTIIVYNPNEKGCLAHWQAINPKEWKEITEATTITELAEIAEHIHAYKFNFDK